MKKVNIIFSAEKRPRDDSFNDGKPFKEVTFDSVASVHYRDGGLSIRFADSLDVEYFYPWHTIDRVKVTFDAVCESANKAG